MKAKDVKPPTDNNVRLSILRINKPEAVRGVTDDPPPTESPPSADPGPSPEPAPVAESLPSFTPRSVDDVDFDEAAFQSALEGSASIGAKGEEVRGTVIGHESDGVYVDIGGKAPGWLPRQECGLGASSTWWSSSPKGSN